MVIAPAGRNAPVAPIPVVLGVSPSSRAASAGGMDRRSAISSKESAENARSLWASSWRVFSATAARSAIVRSTSSAARAACSVRSTVASFSDLVTSFDSRACSRLGWSLPSMPAVWSVSFSSLVNAATLPAAKSNGRTWVPTRCLTRSLWMLSRAISQPLRFFLRAILK